MSDSKPAVRLRALNGRDVSLGFVPLTEHGKLARPAVTACTNAIDSKDSAEAFPRCAAKLVLQLQHARKELAASNTNPVALPAELGSAWQHCSVLRRHWSVLQLSADVLRPASTDLLQIASSSKYFSTSVAALEIARFAERNAALSRC